MVFYVLVTAPSPAAPGRRRDRAWRQPDEEPYKKELKNHAKNIFKNILKTCKKHFQTILKHKKNIKPYTTL